MTLFALMITLFLGDVVVVTTTIQAAVDAAKPGDTIFVPPGNYRGGILIDKNDITLTGSREAVIDASDFSTGITVGTGRLLRGEGGLRCPPLAVRNFTLNGLTIKNPRFSGIFLIGVDGYRLSGTTYIENQVYGPFPICSRNGRIDFNSVTVRNASTTVDAGIYVGGDDTVTVSDNHVSGYAIGVEIENSSNAIIENNVLSGNTCGILVIVLPGLPQPFTENVRIERNAVIHNNLPNPVPFSPTDSLGILPTGTGILNFGGDRVRIRDNQVIGNDSLGIAIMRTPFTATDPRVEPNPDGNEVRGNVILENGRNPDPVRAPAAVDVLYDLSGMGNCFARNTIGTESPAGVTSRFPCGERKRPVLR